MPKFSQKSLDRLKTCHPDIQEVLKVAIENGPDFTILEGYRSPERQMELYQLGRSEPGVIVTNVDGVNTVSKHNQEPSLAVDLVPYPVDWNDIERFKVLAAYIRGIAAIKDVPLVHGADWDSDWTHDDHKFIDWPHWELRL